MTGSKLRSDIATFGVIALFPMFFIYNFLVSKNLMGLFPVSYMVAATAIFLPALLVANCSKRLSLRPPVIGFYIALIYFSIVALVNFAHRNPEGYQTQMLLWSISAVLLNFLCYMIGKSMNAEFFGKLSVVAVFLFAGMVLLNIGESGILNLRSSATNSAEDVASYQGIARSVCVIYLFACALYLRRSFTFFLIFLTGGVTLFFCGARSEFLFAVASILSAWVLCLRRFSVFLMYALYAIVIIALLFYNFAELIPDSRMVRITDIFNSSSANSRFEKLVFAMSVIADNPVFGSYGSYTALGGIGHYPHNILSAWVNLGLFGFFAYVGVIMLLWVSAINTFFEQRDRFDYSVFLIFLIYITLSLILSKDYSYMILGLVVGLYLNKEEAVKKNMT